MYWDSFDCEINCEEVYNEVSCDCDDEENGWYEFEPGKFIYNEFVTNP